MENKTINITITEKDGFLYEFIKDCKNIDYMKIYLRDAAELYRFCNSDDGVQEGHLTPENYRDRVLSNKTKEEFVELKKKYEKEVLQYASEFHPDECDCGIMRGPDTEYWFVDEDSRLGFITLYSNYIKMIEEGAKEFGMGREKLRQAEATVIKKLLHPARRKYIFSIPSEVKEENV